MINIWIIIGILFFHWIFDFVFQTHEEAIKKSKDLKYLLSHTFKYALCWFIPILIYRSWFEAVNEPIYGFEILWFIPITFVFHTITDYITSKFSAKLWEKNSIHDFFVLIGFDQFLHFMQLLLTYYLLIRY